MSMMRMLNAMREGLTLGYNLVSTCASLYNTVYVCLCIKMGLLYYDTMRSYVVSRKGYICNYSAT